MQIAINDHDIDEFIGIINRIAQDHPILVDKYLQGKEIEVDAVCDGEDILIPGIMEHIERAGIHSAETVFPYILHRASLRDDENEKIAEYTAKTCERPDMSIGLLNIQFIVCREEVYVIEVNPRSSRTVPYISKVTGIPIVDIASKVYRGTDDQRAWLCSRASEESRLYCHQTAGILIREDCVVLRQALDLK